jgi:predicted AAA+ superfamily ATPase
MVENIEYIKSLRTSINERKTNIPTEPINKVIILYGLRRTGKTFLLYQTAIQNHDCFVYIDFDDERLKQFTADDFETIRESYYELFPERLDTPLYYLLDEIQQIKDWEKFCRRIVERTKDQIIVAGSSTEIFPQNIHTNLRGRSLSFEVFPYSFSEYLEAVKIDFTDKSMFSKQKYEILKAFENYQKWGGFPEVVSAPGEIMKKNIINEYLNALYFKDLVDRYKITNSTLLEALKNKIYSSFSTKFTINSFYNKLKNEIPVSKDLLFQYYNYLMNAKLIYHIEIYSDSVYKKNRNPKKIYIADLSFALKTVHDDTARKLENFVFLEFMKRQVSVNYLDIENCECDFVIGVDGRKEVYQVTYTINDENRNRELNGILKAAKFLQLNEGTIITYNEEDEVTENNILIHIIPAWKWSLKINTN